MVFYLIPVYSYIYFLFTIQSEMWHETSSGKTFTVVDSSFLMEMFRLISFSTEKEVNDVVEHTQGFLGVCATWETRFPSEAISKTKELFNLNFCLSILYFLRSDCFLFTLSARTVVCSIFKWTTRGQSTKREKIDSSEIRRAIQSQELETFKNLRKYLPVPVQILMPKKQRF